MTYSEIGDRVQITMTRYDYERLLVMLGCACGAASRYNDTAQFYAWLRFVNELNNGNPDFIPYEIPEEYANQG